jgi:prepilin-type N-terminal cleavage/methylation domain-containing protein
MKSSQHSRAGFTLLEVLLAILLAGGIMTAVLLLTVGLGDIWRGTTPVRNLEVHSRQVVDFLKRGFRRALPVETDGLAYVFLDHSSGEHNTSGDPLLTWEVRETDGMISWRDQSLPYVIYQLEVVKDVGLVLYWQSRLEVDFEEVPPRQTLLSAFVSGIEFHYYDSEMEMWELEDEPRSNTERLYDIPNRIKIIFEAEEEDPLTYVINLPNSNQGLPVF